MKRWLYPPMDCSPWRRQAGPRTPLAAFRLGEGIWLPDVRVRRPPEPGWRAFPFARRDLGPDHLPGSGPAAVHQWSALSRLDAGVWHSPHYAGEPICHLESLARFILSKGLALNTMKPNPGQTRRPDTRSPRSCAGCGQARAPGRCCPLSRLMRWRPRKRPRQNFPALPASAAGKRLARVRPGPGLWPWSCIIPSCRKSRSCGFMRVGMRALAYTVNDDEAIATTLWSMGMDGLITDAVDRFLPFESEDAAQQDAVTPSDSSAGGPPTPCREARRRSPCQPLAAAHIAITRAWQSHEASRHQDVAQGLCRWPCRPGMARTAA